MEEFLANAQLYIDTSPWLAFAAVFVGGALTAASPCVLAMVPLVISFVGGYEGLSGWRRSLGFSLAFAFGLAVTFTAMGFVAVMFGRLFGDMGQLWPWIIAAVCLVMAAHLWGLWSFSVPEWLSAYRPARSGALGAFALGLLFGLVSAPCAAPVLVVVLTFVASKAHMAYGLGLLWTYALGHCLLVIAAGVSVGFAKGLLASSRYQKVNQMMQKTAGLVLVGVGVYIVYVSG
jgi:cytochrome c biogenesis protein CcdA